MADAKKMPCPFCGSEDIDTDVVENGTYTAFCNSCNAFGPLATLLTERAIEAWNTRAPLLSTGVDVKKLAVDCRIAYQQWEEETGSGVPLDPPEIYIERVLTTALSDSSAEIERLRALPQMINDKVERLSRGGYSHKQILDEAVAMIRAALSGEAGKGASDE